MRLLRVKRHEVERITIEKIFTNIRSPKPPPT